MKKGFLNTVTKKNLNELEIPRNFNHVHSGSIAEQSINEVKKALNVNNLDSTHALVDHGGIVPDIYKLPNDIKNKELSNLLNGTYNVTGAFSYKTRSSFAGVSIWTVKEKLPSKIEPTPGSNIDKILGDVSTKLCNMIVENDNISDTRWRMDDYFALSYVSNGSNEGNNRIFVMGRYTVMVRFSNDRIKYKAAMETYTNVKLWTDHISMKRNYNDQSERMREIGKAYKLAERTIVILENDDANIVDKLRLTINTFNDITNTAHLNELYSMYSFADFATEFSLKCYTMSKYSYWCRTWTMQEQHLSNTITYCYIVLNKLVEIVNTESIVEHLVKLRKIIWVIEDKYKHDNKVITMLITLNNYVQSVTRFISGEEKNKNATLLGLLDYFNMDSMLFYDMIQNTRSSSSKNEFNEAVCIATGIYEYDERKRWYRILAKMVDNGFIPVKTCYNIGGDSWLPDVLNKEHMFAKETETVQYISIVMKQFMRVNSLIMGTKTVLSENGSLVIKAKAIVLQILELEPKGGCEQINQDVTLKMAKECYRFNATLKVKSDKIQAQLKGTIEAMKNIKIRDTIKFILAGEWWIALNDTGNKSFGRFALDRGSLAVANEAIKHCAISGYNVLKGDTRVPTNSYYL